MSKRDLLEMEFAVLGITCLSCRLSVAGERPVLESFIKEHRSGVCELEYEVEAIDPPGLAGRRLKLRLPQRPS